MADYIERRALLEKAWDADTRCGYVQVVDVGDIESAEAADVAPVAHGRWIKTDHGNDTLLASCSQCNYPVDWWRGKTKYCPNCGAKMDGDE